MKQRSPDSTLRLTLLGCLAASQITLAHRADVPDFVIMACFIWLGGSLPLVEYELAGAASSLRDLPMPQFLVGIVALLWSLLVLTHAAQLYDPLLWFLPLAVLAGLALLAGLSWKGRRLREVIVIALLLPAQGLLNVLWPKELLSELTAQSSAFLLWLTGMPAYPEGQTIVLPDHVLWVDGLCTGYLTLSLSIATLVLLVVLLPPAPLPARFRWALPWLGAAVVAALLASAFLINSVRIALLAYTDQQQAVPASEFWRSFDFWHLGAGAQLFSLLASGWVCGTYLLVLEAQRRHRTRSRIAP
ncbi:archaeosortase/exosortase family protein [Synechococcus sp. GFB01]|uniref:archaeosortase/exosortase family protein n=1 Tax=Synechococcus sp. GFB01 TaxID=1662190 RepID=UPI00064E5B55|nr:archaeosortase/exosortase family protein [Synechococcus sp. GFB01]KMM17586.1 hypothetical protein SYNGFB01_03165 [Synechococcus sp. GFB01]